MGWHLSRREMLQLVASSALLPLASCAGGLSARTAFAQRTFFNFNTVCTIGGDMDARVLDEAQELCKRCEQLFSRTIATSDVGRINAAEGAPVEVDALTAELVECSLEYCAASDGLFDITIGAVSELWDFVEGVVPTDEAIAAALPHVGWECVCVDGATVRLEDPKARIDLGGIAKGFVTDKLMELFSQRGVEDAFVNLGGNVAVMGKNEQSKPWSIGVRDPFDESGSKVVARVEATTGSLVTSGLYERSFEKDGRRYWHILDPRTGYPVETDLVSASIFSAVSIDGDGYTKPLFMLDHNEALAFVEHRGIQALLVTEDGSILTTPDSDFVVE